MTEVPSTVGLRPSMISSLMPDWRESTRAWIALRREDFTESTLEGSLRAYKTSRWLADHVVGPGAIAKTGAVLLGMLATGISGGAWGGWPAGIIGALLGFALIVWNGGFMSGGSYVCGLRRPIDS